MSNLFEKSVIYIVATPIGNLSDITPRALDVLRAVDIIAAEDTRQAKKLLSSFDINNKKVISYYDQTESKKSSQLIDKVKNEGLSIALISDAGTPCVSDPGFRLVKLAKEEGIRVCPIPGPSSLTTLVSASGLPSDRFIFVGFLPQKAIPRQREIQSWKNYKASVVFYESVRRLETSLREISEVYHNAQVCVGRELTKLYEEIVTLNIFDSIVWASSHKSLKGEVSVMVDIGDYTEFIDSDELKRQIAERYNQGASLRDLLREMKDCGLDRGDLYQLLLSVKSEME